MNRNCAINHTLNSTALLVKFGYMARTGATSSCKKSSTCCGALPMKVAGSSKDCI